MTPAGDPSTLRTFVRRGNNFALTSRRKVQPRVYVTRYGDNCGQGVCTTPSVATSPTSSRTIRKVKPTQNLMRWENGAYMPVSLNAKGRRFATVRPRWSASLVCRWWLFATTAFPTRSSKLRKNGL